MRTRPITAGRQSSRRCAEAAHFAPKAKRAIYLFMSGGPPQMDLLDYKPNLAALYDKDIPDSVRGSQQLTGMTAGQARFPIAPSHWAFQALRPDRDLGERSAAVHGAHGRRPHHHQVDQHRSHQSRAGHHADEHRQHECGQAMPGRVAFLWAGQHERQSAHLHGAADQDRIPRRTTSPFHRGCGAADFFRRSMRASACARAAIPCSI